MDDEIEDMVGDIKYTDSQKSVATSNVYSLDFTDSSSDKNNSSGKDTYVIECDDSDDIDSDKTFQLHNNQSIIDLKNYCVKVNHDADVQCENVQRLNRSATASLHKCCILAQETHFTQTSKTIMELAEAESIKKTVLNKSLETQTSLLSIIENNTVQYTLELSETYTNLIKNKMDNIEYNTNNLHDITCDQVFTNSLDDGSSKFPMSEKTEENRSDDDSSTGEIIKIINDESDDNVLGEEQNEVHYGNGDNFKISSESSMDVEEYSFADIESKIVSINEDSISDVSEVPTSLDNDVEDLYKKIADNLELRPIETACESEIRHIGILTPLTEESLTKNGSFLDLTPNINNITSDDSKKDIIFTNNAGNKIKILPDDTKKESLKLPAIPNVPSCPNSPHFYLFSINSPYRLYNKSNDCPFEEQKDRWEIGSKELASGESTLISRRNDILQDRDQYVQLPPIHLEGHIMNNYKTKPDAPLNEKARKYSSPTTESVHDAISIKDRIKELKTTTKKTKQWTYPKYFPSTESRTSRSVSPNSNSPDESKLGDIAERGCEALCVELLRRLRSSSWLEVTDTLQDASIVLEKFWGVITENRIADLIRHVSAHIDSPRTQVARSACSTLAAIIKNTNYTKKPDFHEAVTILLTKTGNFSRPVRRAANVALDDIVCGVELTHAVTALCVHGTSHKSPLVRCAAARLLVVCCALANGGRELLRTRPASAAVARRHALRSMAALLDDKNTDTRKYAERLYSMLRPLNNFEAYYVTDVDVELATRQMKKYDQLLLCGPHREAR